MKKLILIPLLMVLGSPVMAEQCETEQTICYDTVYREEYIPGTEENPGTIRTWKETVQVLCNPEGPHSTQ